MAVILRNNCEINGFGKDYYKIKAFLSEQINSSFSYGRWDWMMKHGQLNESELSRIGIWEDDHEIVAVALYESELGNGHFCVQDGYAYLKEEMLLYAEKHLNKTDRTTGNNYFDAFLGDNDYEFHRIAHKNGYFPTINKERDAYFPINERCLDYQLPEGFRISSMADTYDVIQYGEVLYKGFDHDVENKTFTAKQIETFHLEFSAPGVNKKLKTIVLDPEGNFAAYCGMWYEEGVPFGILEPLATIPKYRKMGLGRAVVYEAIRQCQNLGAKTIFVGSSQQFYYSIGFAPYQNGTYWAKEIYY